MARFSRAKSTGSLRVVQAKSRRVAAHVDTMREAKINADFWSKASCSPMEIQERFPSGSWVTIKTVKPKSCKRGRR